MPLTLSSLEKSVNEVMRDRRNFITTDTYSGPDRRVKQGKLPGAGNRRLRQEGIVDPAKVYKARFRS